MSLTVMTYLKDAIAKQMEYLVELSRVTWVVIVAAGVIVYCLYVLNILSIVLGN